MALTPTISMLKAEKDGNRVTVTVNLKVNDGTSDVIDQDFSASFRPGIDDGVKKDIEDKLKSQMQLAIDEYKDAQDITKKPAFLAIKNSLETALVM